MAGKPGKSGPPGNLNAAKNGMHAWRLRRALPPEKQHIRELVSEEEAGLVAHCGGPENVSTPELLLIRDTGTAGGLVLLGMEEAARRGCIAINAEGQWDFMPGLQRIKGLLDTRRQNLIALGLNKRAKEIPTLEQYLSERYGDGDGNAAQDALGDSRMADHEQAATPGSTADSESPT